MGWSTTEDTGFASGGMEIPCRLSKPARPGRFPAMLVFHGMNGPNDAFHRLVERFGEEGYVGLAVHWQTHEKDPADKVLMRYITDAADFLRRQECVDGNRIGIAGFCRGGGIVLLALGHHAFLRAGISFHGVPTYPELSENKPRHPAEVAEQLTAPLLILHGMSDPTGRIEDMFRLAQRLNGQGKPFQLTAYSGVRHAFVLPGGRDYDPDASTDAWNQALRFLGTRLA